MLNFPILNIRIVDSTANINKHYKVAIGRNDFRWLGLNVTPEELRASIWADIQKERLITERHHQSPNLKLLRRISENPKDYVLVLGKGFELEHLQVIIRACSFLAYIESLNPMNYIFNDQFQSPMTPTQYYEFLQGLGIKLNLVKP
ncbi:MAG TPA: hypothetical protein DCQ51_13480 [Planktothrix sp. UBA8407]|jgi:hypothetical protein|nr:hypothetical protein [Planktothrix sp. UBA8407]